MSLAYATKIEAEMARERELLGNCERVCARTTGFTTDGLAVDCELRTEERLALARALADRVMERAESQMRRDMAAVLEMLPELNRIAGTGGVSDA